jgi:hypothetical protein
MKGTAVDQLTPQVFTWGGLLFLALVVGITLQFFGRELTLGLGVGMVVGLANFKAIAFILKQVLGPSGVNKVLYGIFGFLKFIILVAVFFGLIYFELFNVYGIVGGFSSVLLLVMVEGLVRASRYSRQELTEEKVHA